jgi:threonine/homoserine/homoserine lactone efflux protein
MDRLIALSGLLCMAALTPSPNNLVVLREAGRTGIRGALPAIAGIVLGGLLLLTVMALGVGAAFAAHASLRLWVGALGSLYLAWLGMVLLMVGIAPRHTTDVAREPARPTGIPGLVGFQFLNPKSWVMVLTVLAALPVTGLFDFLPLAGLFVLIPASCLLLWASLGALLARWLGQPMVRRVVDAVMGALLVVCAGLLLTGL